MSLELNEEIDIKSETIEEHDFMSSDTDIKNEVFEVHDTKVLSKEPSGHSMHTTLSGCESDIKIDVNPVEIGEEVATMSMLKHSISEYSHTCQICGLSFSEQHKLMQHPKKIHQIGYINASHTCFVCQETFVTQCSFSIHLVSHAKLLYRVFKCGKICNYPYVCKVCGITHNSKVRVVQHIKSVHLGLKEYKCKVCSTYFTKNFNLLKHFSLHHSFIEPFSCEFCSYTSSTRTNLKLHLLAKHELNEDSVASLLPASNVCKIFLICTVCNVEFKSRNEFHQHISDVHEGLDPIKCPVCQKDFTCIVKLIIHIRTHGGKKQPFSYGMCEERSSIENARSTLLVKCQKKSKEPSGSSSYECGTCKKVFTCMDQLKEHNLELHNSNSFSCFKCDKCDMFGSFDSLEQHIAKNHNKNSSLSFNIYRANFSSAQGPKYLSAYMVENTFETLQFEDTELLVSPDTKIGIVRCEICKQDFDNPTSLMDHFIKIHKNNQKPKSLQQNRREHQIVSQREHRTAEYLKNRLGSSPVKPQLQQAMEGRKVTPVYKTTVSSHAEDLITKVKPCCVLLDREEVTRYLAHLDKREEGTVGSSTIEDLPPPLATPPVKVYPSHPCGRVRVTSDHLLSAATSNMGLVCNNIEPRAIVEPKQLCVLNSGDGEVSSNNCIQNANLASQELGNFEEMYIRSEPIFSEVSDFFDPLSI